MASVTHYNNVYLLILVVTENMTDPVFIGYKAEGTITKSVDGTDTVYDNLEPFRNGDWERQCRAITQDKWKRVDCLVR